MSERYQHGSIAMKLYAYLLEHAYGADHAIEAERLALAMQLPFGGRGTSPGIHVWMAVRAAVDRGYLICGGPSGYFVPSNHAEVERTRADLERRAVAMRSRADAIRAMAIRQFGPMVAEGGVCGGTGVSEGEARAGVDEP